MVRKNDGGVVRFLASAAMVFSLVAASQAAGEKKEGKPAAADSSWQLIPEDAAFYSALLRNREQVEIVTRSKAWASLMAMPSIQQGLARLKEMAENAESPLGRAKAVWENPQIQDLVKMLGDMFSTDVFVYADPSLIDVLELAQKVNYANTYGPLLLQATGQTEGESEGELRGGLVLSTLANNVQQIRVPRLIFGFKVQDTQRARRRVDELAGLLTGILLTKPEWSKVLDRARIDGYDYVTLTLDAQMLPWDQVPTEKLKRVERKEGDAEKVIARLKQLKLVLAFGVRGDYLLVCLGESTEGLARLGKGKTLAERPEMKPLAKYARQRLTSISYLSREMASRLALSAKDVESLRKVLEEILEKTDLSEEQKARIRKDADALAADLKRLLPRPGARMAFSFLTAQGEESYAYRWHEGYTAAALKPLGLLEHVGGNPILAVVARLDVSPEGYDLLARWAKTAFRYFEEFGVPRLRPKEQEQYEEVKKELLPLVERADKANREFLIPALDGQIGLVFDAKLKTSQWPKPVPKTERPLPVPELALVIGVKDADKLRQAYTAYQGILDDLVDAVRKLDPKAVPSDYKIPWPEASQIQGGTMISYQLPPRWKFDPRIRPNAALSQDVLVITASPSQSERLLKATPFRSYGVLNNPRKPLAAALALDWAALVDAATPWVELATRSIAAKKLHIADDEARKTEVDKIVQQARTVLAALKALRNLTAEFYGEDGALVEHGRAEIRDIR